MAAIPAGGTARLRGRNSTLRVCGQKLLVSHLVFRRVLAFVSPPTRSAHRRISRRLSGVVENGIGSAINALVHVRLPKYILPPDLFRSQRATYRQDGFLSALRSFARFWFPSSFSRYVRRCHRSEAPSQIPGGNRCWNVLRTRESTHR